MKAQLDGAEAGSDRQLLDYKGYLAAAITYDHTLAPQLSPAAIVNFM